MRKSAYLVALLLAQSSLSAMPEKGVVVAGHAEFNTLDAHSLEIITSDKTIINYKRFDISEKEKVNFKQPSSKSTLLARVKGSSQPSKILGNLSSNGKIFLVNSKGIYFGPKSTVNASSFVASTLNIKDDDFLDDKFEFYLESNAKKSSIVNEGVIETSEGFVGLFSPFIQNKGIIRAKAGKVALASAEKVTLDFTGDGLIQFSVEGDLKDSLIENYGHIEALGGSVEITLQAAKNIIRRIVNSEGILPVNDIIEEDGVIRLVSKSTICADTIRIEGNQGTKIDIQGTIDASSPNAKGGTVHLLGQNVQLIGTKVDVSGDMGGGYVFIGGDYQGKGGLPTSENTVIDKGSEIYADAYTKGDGGQVIVWADDTTLFDGKIFARGGVLEGDGGFVETSGEENLSVTSGFVDTSALLGNYGNWLLDPAAIVVATGGKGSLVQCANCGTTGTVTIAPTTIAAASSNVILCAQRNASSSITITDPISLNNPGISLSLTAGSTNVGPISLNNSITTKGGAINFTGVVTVGAGVTVNTTNSAAAGADIFFSNTLNGAQSLALTAGTSGNITFTGAVGATTPLTALTASGSSIIQTSTAKTTGALSYTAPIAINVGGNITTSGNTLSLLGSVNLSTGTTFDTTNAGSVAAGGNISISALNGAVAATFRAGTGGIVSFSGEVGASTPPSNLVFTSAASIQVGSNITVTGANPLTFPSAVNMTGPGVITSNNANVNFNSTLNGAQSLTIAGGSGTTTFSGAIGGTTPLSSLNVTTATLSQNSSARTTGSLSYTGSTAINLSGNVTTSSGAISMTGPVNLLASPVLDSTNGGGSSGANISFSNTINGAQSLSLRAGTGTVTLSGRVGGTAPLTNLSFTSAGLIQLGASLTVTGANPIIFPSAVSLTGPSTITSNNASVSFNSTLNGSQTLSVIGGSGTVTMAGAIGGVSPLSSLSITAATVSQGSSAQVVGAVSYTGGTALQLGGSITTNGSAISMTGPLTLTNSLALNTTNNAATGQNISFSSTVNGAQSLTLVAGTGGSITFGGAVGGGTSLNALTITSANNVTALALTASSLTQTAGSGSSTFNGAINTSGSSGVSITGTTINVNNNMTTTGGGPLTFTHSGTLTFASGVALNSGGLFSDNGPGSTVFAGSFSLTTNAQNIFITPAITLGGTLSLSTGTGVGDISFENTVNGAQNLNLSSGIGNISFASAVGGTAPLNTITVTTANNVIAGSISAAAFNQIAGTGTTTLNGAIALSGASGFVFVGNNLTINSSLTTAANGPANIQVAGTLRLGASSSLSLDGPFMQSGSGMTQSAGSITTTNDTVQFGGVLVLTGATSINSGSGIGNIVFSDRVEGPGALTLTAGTGNVTFSAAVGGSTRIGALQLNSSTSLSTLGITASSINVTSTGTSTLNGNLNSSGAAGIQIVGNNVNRSGTITTTNSGSYIVANSGLLTITLPGSSVIDGSYTQTGGAVSISGSISTTNGTISFAGPLTLTGDLSLNSSAGGKDIIFASAVEGTTAGAQSLTLRSGTGHISLGGNLGATTRLGAFTVPSAANLTALGIRSSSISQLAGSGTSMFNGALNTNTSSGISLNGANITFNSGVTTTAAGPFSVQNSGSLTLSSGNSLDIAGAFTQLGSINNLAGSINAGGAISFSGPLSLSGTTVLTTSNQNITLSSSVNGNGNLTLVAGTGDIFLSGAIGQSARIGDLIITSVRNLNASHIQAASITQSAGSGTSTLSGNLNTDTSGGIHLTGTNFVRAGSIVTTHLGPFIISNSGTIVATSGNSATVDGEYSQTGGAVTFTGSLTTNNQPISFGGALTLAGQVTLNSGGGNISTSTVDGAFNFSVAAGAGNLTFGTLGGTTPLGILTLSSSGTVSTQAITASSLTQIGNASTTFNGAIATSSVGGISLIGSSFSFLGAVSTALSGPISITESSSLSIGAAMNISGAFTQSGSGAVSLDSNITTLNQNITFSAPL